MDISNPKNPQGPSNGRVWTCMTQGCLGPQNSQAFEGSGFLPIGSMYSIFAYIYHISPLKNQPNVAKYTSPMDATG